MNPLNLIGLMQSMSDPEKLQEMFSGVTAPLQTMAAGIAALQAAVIEQNRRLHDIEQQLTRLERTLMEDATDGN